ncbi:MAG: gliding motility-associated C-terminal domain-containing protein [Bacteroidales bacterium]|nr:gliding motility-associated C-terminal domain-containing protein [Bacteroidales bacterium]
MKKFYLLMIVSLVIFSVNAQIKFQKRYAIGNTYNFLTSVVQNPDKSYIMAGHGINIGQYELDVVKTDSTGTILWAKRYYSPVFLATDYYESGKLIRTSDGGYIMCGTRKTDAFVMKLDASGNVSWSKTYYISGASYHFLKNIKQTSDGGYIAVGYMRNASTDSLDAFIVKITSNGTLSWGGRWNNQTVNSDDSFIDVAEDQGNGFVAVGYTSQVFGADTTWDALIVKFNTNGTIGWSNVLGDNNQDEEASVIIKQGNNFYIAGNTTQGALGTDFFFMEMSTSGTQNWTRRFGYGLADLMFKILPTSTGFSLVGGEITMGGNIVKADFNSSGQYITNTGYAYGGSWAFPVNVDAQKTTDNGWIMGVMSIEYAYYLLKANAAGSTGCYENTFNPTITTFTFTQDAFTGTYSTNVTSGNPSVSTGSFTVSQTVTDCQFVPCDTPVVSITPTNPTICQGQSVTLTASGSNGSGPVTSWSWNTGQTTASINVSPSSTTTYTVTGTVGSCPSQPVQVTVTVNPVPSVSISGNNNICQGQSTTLTATGGGTYTWSNGVTGPTNIVNPSSTTTYTVTVTNTYNCTNTASVQVTVNPLPNASINGPSSVCSGQNVSLTASGGDTYLWNNGSTANPLNLNPTSSATYSVTVTNSSTGCSSTASHSITVNPNPIVAIAGDTIICEGYSTTLTASGGNSYIWSNGATTPSITVTPPLGTSIYTVTVTNTSTSCYTVRNVTVQVVSAPNASISGNNAICPGQSTTLTASGGTTYLWSTGNTTASIQVSPTSTTTYTVSVYAGTCFSTASIQVIVHTPPTVSVTGQNVSCFNGNNGSATASVTAGNPPYNYLWNNGQTSSTINNLTNGTYSVTVTDGNGCTGTAQTTITQPQAISATYIVSHVSCFGGNNGTISLTTSGGTAPYSFAWSNGASSSTNTNLSVGSYTVTITDANNCSHIVQNININQPASPLSIVTDSVRHVSCFGENNGFIMVHGIGGTAPYQYTWSNNANTNSIAFLTAGIYRVTVTDANGCSDIDTIVINQPPAIVVHSQITNASCNYGKDGKIELEVTGGVSPYTYAWSNNVTQPINQNIGSGNYFVTITDNTNCAFVDTFLVKASEIDCIVIPELITPNGDGVNDKFEIKGIQYFEKVDIEIYNRWGSKIFSFSGSGLEYMDPTKQWDGTYKDKEKCSPCSFVYIVNVYSGKNPYQGIVTVKQ